MSRPTKETSIMRKKRNETFDLSKSTALHVWCRTVRQAFLLAHLYRLNWVRERIEHLAALFAIEVSFHAFLSNHYHLVIRYLPDLVESWTDEEVMRRAIQIFPHKFGRLGIRDCKKPCEKRLNALLADKKLVKEMRDRLPDPSWFMKQLNQHIAKRVNEEEECTGRLFDGPFQCEPILSIFQLVICGLYVDLNEFAAGLATSPETSKGSSIYSRIVGRRPSSPGR